VMVSFVLSTTAPLSISSSRPKTKRTTNWVKIPSGVTFTVLLFGMGDKVTWFCLTIKQWPTWILRFSVPGQSQCEVRYQSPISGKVPTERVASDLPERNMKVRAKVAQVMLRPSSGEKCCHAADAWWWSSECTGDR
jgi:hypothetical protein